jgi:hypothetical protein
METSSNSKIALLAAPKACEGRPPMSKFVSITTPDGFSTHPPPFVKTSPMWTHIEAMEVFCGDQAELFR